MRQCTLLSVLQSTFTKRLFHGDGFNKSQPPPRGSGRAARGAASGQAGGGCPRGRTPALPQHSPPATAKPARRLAKVSGAPGLSPGLRLAPPSRHGHDPEPATENGKRSKPGHHLCLRCRPSAASGCSAHARPRALGLPALCYAR